MNVIKIAVTGASGRVGYAFVFMLLVRSPFKENAPFDLRLLESPNKMDGLKGMQLEIEDCASPLLRRLSCTSNAQEAFRDVDWVIFIGALPRQVGMSRKDLLKVNGKIFSQQGKILDQYASQSVQALVVANPCNTNCMIAMENAPGIPRDRFFAMTLLDELRAKALLAKKASVNVADVRNSNIWGNHSTTLYPDFYHTQIQGQKAQDVIQDELWLQNDFLRLVQERGTEVLKTQRVSSAASAAYATWQTLFYLNYGMASGDYFSIGKVSEGEYGIDPGLVFSFPCYKENGRICVAEGIKHNSFALQKIQLSLKELRQERDGAF